MKRKRKMKITVDIIMTISLFFVSGYQFWGETAHEWVGAVMFLLFIAHHLLNGNWHKNILQGKYTLARLLQLVTDLALFFVMLMEMYSGLALSRKLAAVLPAISGTALARKLHILGAYWGFLLMGFHLGLHWNMVLGMVKKRTGNGKNFRKRMAVSRMAGFATAFYGVSVFIRRDFLTYLFLKSEFVFLDYGEPPVLFYLDHLALMGTCIFAGYYLRKGFTSRIRR